MPLAMITCYQASCEAIRLDIQSHFNLSSVKFTFCLISLMFDFL